MEHKVGDEVSVNFEIIAVYEGMVKCKNKKGTIFVFNNDALNPKVEQTYSKEQMKQIAIWAYEFYRTNNFSDDELEEEFLKQLKSK